MLKQCFLERPAKFTDENHSSKIFRSIFNLFDFERSNLYVVYIKLGFSPSPLNHALKVFVKRVLGGALISCCKSRFFFHVFQSCLELGLKYFWDFDL